MDEPNPSLYPKLAQRMPSRRWLVSLVVVVVSGCSATVNGATATTPASSSTTDTRPPAIAHPSSTHPLTVPGAATPPSTAAHATPPAPASPAGKVWAPDSCHTRGKGLYVLPDPSCTPGATDPAVTQASISATICKAGWTSTVRPPESYTEQLKVEQLVAYGETSPVSDYEEDHLIPLELGGSPTAPPNLWPEPGASPNPKDGVEDAANAAVCDGRISLVAAQEAIAANWIAFGQQLGAIPTSPPAASTPPATVSSPTATCTVTATYSREYNYYDVYVHSNQPDQTVSVTTNGAPPASWHTDSTGYADVYLKAPLSAAGQRVSVSVGGASCEGTLG